MTDEVSIRSIIGTTTIDAAGSSIVLDNPLNEFASTVNLINSPITIADVNSLLLGNVAASGSVNLANNRTDRQRTVE